MSVYPDLKSAIASMENIGRYKLHVVVPLRSDNDLPILAYVRLTDGEECPCCHKVFVAEKPNA